MLRFSTNLFFRLISYSTLDILFKNINNDNALRVLISRSVHSSKNFSKINGTLENWLIFVGGQKSTSGNIFCGDVHLPDRSGRVFHHKRKQSASSRLSILVTALLRLLVHPVLLPGCRLVVTKQIDAKPTFFSSSFSFNIFAPDNGF